MKLVSLAIANLPPIENFKTEGLLDTVVIAGPNGVGKTNILNHILNTFRSPGNSNSCVAVVQATCEAEKLAWNGKESLETNNPADAKVLKKFLQRSKKRGELHSGVLNFDASRVFETIQPYSFNWNFSDPLLEEIGWDQTFSSARHRFQDVVHALYRKVRSQKEEISTKALKLQGQGIGHLPLDFPDPLAKFKVAFARLLPGKQFCDLNEQDQTLLFLAGNSKLPFDRLSSGEREVITVVFDFLLRGPQDSIIVFDEPELHLHPELSYRLLQTLRSSGTRNQFIFCTHSADIISASLDHSVIFVSPATGTGNNQAIAVTEEHESARVLHLLGQSVGVISLGRKIILIEGIESSLDKQTYGAILGVNGTDAILVPTGGKETIRSFSAAVDTVLHKTIWGVDFYMLCDGDTSINTPTLGTNPRLRQLPRYHLENYFLDENHLATVFAILGEPPSSDLRDPAKIKEKIRSFAELRVSQTVALRVANTIRLMCGNIDITPAKCHEMNLDELIAAFKGESASEVARISSHLGPKRLEAIVREEYERVSSALTSSTDDWKSWIPGRPLLKQFAASAKQDITRLKSVYIRESHSAPVDPFAEIKSIFRQFV